MINNVILWSGLLLLLVLFAASTILINTILKAAISLAVCSAILTVILYLMGAKLAAVLELSVCAGLITAVFVSTISMTEPETVEQFTQKRKERFRRYIYLPVLLIAVGAGVFLLFPNLPLDLSTAHTATDAAAKALLWDSHQLDIFGQIIVVLAGVFSVVVLFRTRTVKK